MGKPRFSVFVVKRGTFWGLLIEKRPACGGPVERVYFCYPPDHDGLLTEDIQDALPGACKMLNPGNQNEAKIVKELKAYAEAAHADGHFDKPRRITQQYSNDRGYPAVLDSCFRAKGSPLRQFFGDSGGYRTGVLKMVHGKEEVAGLASRFEVVQPDEVLAMISGYVRQLLDTSSLLKIGSAQKAEWFRSAGPSAADFEAGFVHNRGDELNALREQIRAHPISMLIGPQASGKTVLVRNLMYDMWQSEDRHARYLDCNAPHRLDSMTLGREIVRSLGTVFLDNVHLATDTLQFLVPRLELVEKTRLVLVARPSYREVQRKEQFKLDSLPQMKLAAQPAVSGIMASFARSYDLPVPTGEVLDGMTKATRDDLWLLAYALQGYATHYGQGEPLAWLRAGVMEHLRQLELPTAPGTARYPEIVVALSGLYYDELDMSERYLLKNLHFDREALNRLVMMGEIVRTTWPEGDVFYGLPHRSIARAYWEHGTRYRDQWASLDRDSFVKDYVDSGPANIFEVLFYLSHRHG